MAYKGVRNGHIHKIFLCRLHELFSSSEKAFFDININEATQAIADVVAEAAEYFGNNDFDVFIIKIRNN